MKTIAFVDATDLASHARHIVAPMRRFAALQNAQGFLGHFLRDIPSRSAATPLVGQDDDRVNYMESPLGQFLGSIAKAGEVGRKN